MNTRAAGRVTNRMLLLSAAALLIALNMIFFSTAISQPVTNVTIEGGMVTVNTTYREKVGLTSMQLFLGTVEVPLVSRPRILSTFRCGEGEFNYFITQPISATGNYNYSISVVDCAGNFRSDSKPFIVSIRSPPGCGDKFVNASLGEECDDGNTVSGDGCNSFCKSESCGNAVIDLGEVCDSSNLNGFICQSFASQGFTGGVLSCSPTCKSFSFINCSKPSGAAKCGDGVIEVGEQCDGTNFGPVTNCQSFDSTFTSGVLYCDPKKCVFNTSECKGPSGGFCGDGQVVVGEQCDGRVRKSCSDFDKFYGQGLSCDNDCTYNTSKCQKPVSKCGDGEVNVERDENCDGLSFLPELKSCSDLKGYTSGVLKCKVDCSLDVSGCTKSQVINSSCYNGVKDGLESDVDCGGICPACPDSRKCESDIDCSSGYCRSGVCSASSCSDGLKNGFESDVDCGGFCEAKCAEKASCSSGSDCATGFCSAGTCFKPSCSDGVHNGFEADVDCGGDCAKKCAIGRKCSYASDCESGFCSSGYCSVERALEDEFEDEVASGTGSKLPLVLLIIGIVMIVASSIFLYWYRVAYLPSRKPKAALQLGRQAQPLKSQALRGPIALSHARAGSLARSSLRVASSKSELLRRLLAKRKAKSGTAKPKPGGEGVKDIRTARPGSVDQASSKPEGVKDEDRVKGIAKEKDAKKDDVFERLKSFVQERGKGLKRK